MKNFGKAILILLGAIIAIPVILAVMGALAGIGMSILIAPGIAGPILLGLLLISVPGIIIGILVSKKDN